MTKLSGVYHPKEAIPHMAACRKKVGYDTGRFGLLRYGVYEYGAQNEIGLNFTGVYQVRHCSNGRFVVKMRFQRTREETPTPARVAIWAKFAAAMAAWQALTDEEKMPYTLRAKKLKMHAHNLFIKEYMLSV